MSSEADFCRYIAAFARGDYPALVRFYHPDVRLTIGTGRELVGPDAIAAFYSSARQQVERTIQVASCFTDGNRLAAELHSRFRVLVDAPSIWERSARPGDVLDIESFVLYDLAEDKRYRRIRAAVFRRTWSSQTQP